eukprot:TRINITY_DN3772_c2_g1_i1.p1 TRINITY_DN3772_c2_g1~~TRINITY_DN3772_c2_g1_i1.p1  ORF type:complete len:322 (-),score=77.44 TRINITY_DN3772_c2_g1_i1:8-925(-)
MNPTRLLCMLAVPSSMSAQELMAFIGSDSKVECTRIIRDDNPLHYMVLLKFFTQDQADNFFFANNRKRFNEIEPEECQLLYVESVTYVNPATPSAPLFPPEGLTELPSCPVCLERLDSSTSGLLTILCNHTFHSECLSQWKTACPVCRHAQTPQGQNVPTCSLCNCNDIRDLWICIVCGHVACGRSSRSHASEHFVQSKHSFALNLESKRVWDYSGDKWVHRIVQSKDGSVVELGETEETHEDGKGKATLVEMEYGQLLEDAAEAAKKDSEIMRQKFDSELGRLQLQLKAAEQHALKAEKEKQRA